MMRIHPVACGYGLAFLIELPGGLLLCDSGSPGQEEVVLAMMRAMGRTDLKVIWITHAHYDHYGSAAALRGLTGAPIGAHPADAQSMASGKSPLGATHGYGFLLRLVLPLINRMRPLPAATPDFTLEDGETFERFGWEEVRVLHTPGHTPGHTCLLLPGGIAMAGDLIASTPWRRKQFLLASDWRQLARSLARLQAARPEWVYSGHARRPLPAEVLQKMN